MQLQNKVAIVTGAGSGIGRAIAVRLAHDGAQVVVVGQRRERLDETLRQIEANGGRALAVACDIADTEQVQSMVRTTVEHFRRIDILVNNAAKNRPPQPLPETVADLPEDWWAATLAVNLSGYFYCCKYVLIEMLRSGGGSIINIASTSGLAGNTNQGAYVPSKHGVIGLTKSIALDYGAKNIRANAICPGFIETERSLHFGNAVRGPDWQARKLADIPLHRFGRPEDVAHLAAFLASDDAAFISGAAIPIDGGTAAKR
jgi:3-oxoacyl-[acyl-carrier protein] reductase